MSYGSVEVVREILGLEDDSEDERIARFLKLSNTWLGVFAPADILDDLDDDTKDAATNFHAAYLYRLSTGRFEDAVSPTATEFRDEGTRILEQAINNEAEVFKIRKVEPR